MRLRKVAEAEQRISSLPARSASKFTKKPARTGFIGRGMAGFRPEPDRFRTDRALIFYFDAFSYAIPRPPWIKSGVGFRLRMSPSIKSALIKTGPRSHPFVGHNLFGKNRFPLSDHARVPAHDSLQMIPKYEDAHFDTHRQIRGFVYTWLSGSNLRS